MPQVRQLAAIMFTDIVGYTALMGKDEEKAFELLNKNRQLQKPIITQFSGRWIKELGDGVMASFNTVSDAVNAAIAIQQSCNQTNEYRLRIGIHLGEVIFEDNDVFGDGVNIASRIQAIAHPGSIFISEPVHNNIINKKDITTEFVKTETLKNVREPMKIYQAIAEGVTVAPPGPLNLKVKPVGKAWYLIFALTVLLVAGYFFIQFTSKSRINPGNLTPGKSIAVLPFADMSPKKDQEYLSDGLAEEIINSISIIKDLKVIGRTSSFQFKGKGFDAQEIGKKLNVNIVLEGSIQKSGNNLRIITQLIRVNDNSTIWSQRFDKELKDIFAIQDSVANKIVEKLRLTISESEKPRLTKKETDPEVYSLYLKGLHTYKENEFEKSIEYNLKATGIDSLFAPSYAYLALAKIWLINRSNAYTDFNAIREAKEYANKAIRLDPNLPEGYSALGLLSWSIEIDFAAAKMNFEKSIQLNPSASLINNRYAYFLIWMGEFEKARKLGLNAINSDPADYNGYVIVANAYTFRKKFREAEKYITEGKRLFPGHFAFENPYIQNKFFSGNYDEAIQSIRAILSKKPNNETGNMLSILCLSYYRKGDLAASNAVIQHLKERVQSPNLSIHYSLARIYSQYQMKDSCFFALEKAFERREPDLKLLKIDPLLDPVRQDPRYLQMYRKYGYDKYQ